MHRAKINNWRDNNMLLNEAHFEKDWKMSLNNDYRRYKIASIVHYIIHFGAVLLASLYILQGYSISISIDTGTDDSYRSLGAGKQANIDKCANHCGCSLPTKSQ